MAKTVRCPICNVAVKPENLLRHLNDTHPRHPDISGFRETLKQEPTRFAPKKAAAPIRIKSWHLAVVALVVLIGVGAYYVAPYLNPSASEPFPCVTGGLVYHWHATLSIFSGSAPVTIPANVGISAGCAEPVHTHDTSGTIHIETDVGRLYSVGDFFAVWGKSFDSPTQMFVNGTAASLSSAVVLYNQETISLYYTSFA